MTEELQQVATREWHTRARVRILEDTTSMSVSPMRMRTFHAGEELEMIQWGREGRTIERHSWWTSFDIDGAHIIDAEKVEVITIIEEVVP